MCGRYSVFTDDGDSLMKTFLKRAGITEEIGEIYPTAFAPIIHEINNVICSRRGVWGFKGYSASTVFNARVETVTVKDIFSKDFENRRCVIPATAFYEWNHKDGVDGTKQMYRFTLPSEDIMYMCGFYKLINNVKHYVILTTEANEDMEDIHTRMPVIIPQSRVKEYLLNNFYCYDIACSLPPKLSRRAI